MNGRVWGLKLSLFIKTDCICGLTYKAVSILFSAMTILSAVFQPIK